MSLSQCNIPLLCSRVHHRPWRLGEAPGLGASLLRGGPRTAGRRVSAQLSGDEEARLGQASRPVQALVPAGSAQPWSARGGRRDHSECPGCQTSRALHVGRDEVVQVARIQGGASFPSGSTHRLSPASTQKRTRTQKTFATLLIYSRFLPLSQWATSCRTPE